MKKIIALCLIALMTVGIASAQQKKNEKQVVTTAFLTDIDCPHCAKKIDNTIPFEKGVKEVKVDVPTKTVTITYDPSKTNTETLIKAMAKIKVKAEVKK